MGRFRGTLAGGSPRDSVAAPVGGEVASLEPLLRRGAWVRVQADAASCWVLIPGSRVLCLTPRAPRRTRRKQRPQSPPPAVFPGTSRDGSGPRWCLSSPGQEHFPGLLRRLPRGEESGLGEGTLRPMTPSMAVVSRGLRGGRDPAGWGWGAAF